MLTDEFKREERYIVFKVSDLGNSLKGDDIRVLAREYAKYRQSKGKPPLECLVVESDWPEYEPTWKAIAARMTGRAIEAEVLQAQEPAALDKLLNDFAITCAFGSADERVSAATAIKSLFAAPQPTAPCPKCAQYEIDFALEHDDKIALQAKVAEQVAEIERLQSKLDLLVIERDAQSALISDQQADVEKQTEISNNFAAQVRQQDETITSLRAEVERLTKEIDFRQSLLRESNRNCAEHAGVVWTRNVTIDKLKQEARMHAQEARTANATIYEIYQAISGSTGEPGNWRGAEPVRTYIKEKAALIEKCEKALIEARDDVYSELIRAKQSAGYKRYDDEIKRQMAQLVRHDEALAAIAAQKGGAK